MSGSQPRVAVYIDPPTHHFLDNRLFDDDAGRLNGDGQNAPYAHLRARFSEMGIDVQTADRLPSRPGDDVLNLYFSLGRYDDLPRLRGRPDVVLSGFFALECPIVEPRLYRVLPRLARAFRRIYSWTDSTSLRRFTGADLQLHEFRWPQSFDDVHEDLWRRAGRRFLVMINANKLPRIYWRELYTERMRAVEYFARTGEIDLYGKGWDRPPVRVGRTWVPWTVKRPALAIQDWWSERRPDALLVAARGVWRGPAASKRDVLSQYDFSLCFENCVLRGWITEKIFDCFFAGVVPVYWGAPEIADVVPAACYIDARNFGGYEELHDFLRSRTTQDKTNYREAAREFLRSPAYRAFTREAFTHHFLDCAAEDAGVGHR